MADAPSTIDRPFAAPAWPADAVERWPISRLSEYAQNPRAHSPEQVAQIARSISEFGWTIPALVDEVGLLIAGHGRLAAARLLGITEIPVMVARGWTDEQKRAYRIADNALPLNASWALAPLRLELAELKLAGFDLELTGFNDLQLVSFMSGLPGEQPPERPVTPPVAPVSRVGDVWIIGRHRILCGDCRDAAQVGRFLGAARINVAFTSPPYAEQRAYDETSGFRPVPPDQYVEWFHPVAENVARHLAPDGSWFINIKPSADGLDTSLYVMDLVIAHVRAWGWHFATEFCWERVGVPKSVTRRFKNQFEPIYQFAHGDWKMRPKAVTHPSGDVPIPGGPGVGYTSWASAQGGNGPMFGAQKGRFGATGHYDGRPNTDQGKRGFPTSEKNQGTGWQQVGPLGIPPEFIGEGMAYPGNRLPPFTGTHEALGHAAAFPVGLPAWFALAFSDPGDLLFDPFLGSGSSIIAAEQNGRVGYGIEISPTYVDVSVERWANLTGGDPVLAATGQSFADVARDRGVEIVPAKDRAASVSAGDVHRSLSEPMPPNGANVGMRRAKKGAAKAAPAL